MHRFVIETKETYRIESPRYGLRPESAAEFIELLDPHIQRRDPWFEQRQFGIEGMVEKKVVSFFLQVFPCMFCKKTSEILRPENDCVYGRRIGRYTPDRLVVRVGDIEVALVNPSQEPR